MGNSAASTDRACVCVSREEAEARRTWLTSGYEMPWNNIDIAEVLFL